MPLSVVVALVIAAVGLAALVVITRRAEVKPGELDSGHPGLDLNHLRRTDKGARRDNIRAQTIISVIVLFAALYVILFQHDADADTKKWAFGAVGTLLGFWLKR